MKEGIAARVARIISGGANALIDAVEGAAPTIVLEEAIREVDGAIDEVRSEMGRALTRRHISNARLMDANNRNEELGDKIDVAIKEDRDDLAEAALGRQMDIVAQIPILEHDIADASQEHKELEGYVAALQAKKREMQEELKNFVLSRDKATGDATGPGATEAGRMAKVEGKVEKASSAFARRMEKETGLSNMPSAVSPKTVAELAELDNLARENRIKERLAELKAKAKD